jgi:hypothetical protein
MALYSVRMTGNPKAVPTIRKGNSAAAIPKGAPVYRVVGDGDITVVATNGTALIGFAASASTAADEIIDYWPAYPGVEFKLDFDGTYAVTKLGVYCEITVASGVPTANLDEVTNHALRFEELVSNNDAPVGKYTGWFSVATTANQMSVEVA